MSKRANFKLGDLKRALTAARQADLRVLSISFPNEGGFSISVERADGTDPGRHPLDWLHDE